MKRILQFALIFSLLFSCYKKQTQENVATPQGTDVYVDVPFIQEYHEGFVIDVDIPEANDVRAVFPDRNDNIWAATGNGIYMKRPNDNAWELKTPKNHHGPAYDIISDKEGNVWVAAWDGVFKNADGELKISEGPEPPVALLAETENGLYAMGPYGIWLNRDGQWEKKNYKTGTSMRSALPDTEGGLLIGTDVGLFHIDNEQTSVIQENEDLISAYVRGLDYSENGDLWVGSLGGVTIRDRSGVKGKKLPADGITNINVNCVKKSPEGTMWVGTDYGITRFTPGQKEYSVRLSRRWLMSDEVRDIAFDKNGNAWIATAYGVSAIKKREMTLAQKADFFYDRLIQRHVRAPWIVARFRLEIPGDTTTIVPDDDDNDGEYTSNYLAMESFRYAVTKDPEAKERAKKAFDFLYLLREVTGSDGFFARTVIPADWERAHDMNRTYTPQQLAEEMVKDPRSKPVEERWRLSKDGVWKWKGDTSSDEYCGHFFGYYCYYTLVADDEEKKRIAGHVSQITDHLMRNDFNAVDIDQTHTRWGVWSPDNLNRDPDWAPEKALNSLEILSFLKFTYHVTGDQKYQEAYLHLIEEEGYLDNAKKLHDANPAFETYFDIFLALYMYPALINLEDNIALKNEYIAHMDRWFQKHKKSKSPFVNFAYNYLKGGNDELENSIFFLRDTPPDLVNWQIDNGKREDLQIVRYPILENLQVDELRPPSEYRTIRWDKTPYNAVAGNPSEEYDPVFWLLPYWMGRYLNLIQNV